MPTPYVGSGNIKTHNKELGRNPFERSELQAIRREDRGYGIGRPNITNYLDDQTKFKQKRISILNQKFHSKGKTDLLQNQKPIQKTGLDPNRVHTPNVLPKTSSEFRTEGKQSLLTSKPIKDRGVKVSPATLKATTRMTEKKHLGHPKLQGKGQTLTTHTTLENLSARARFADWYRSPMKEKNIKRFDAKINIQNVDHLKQMDEIKKGGIHHDMKGSKSISKGGGKSGGGGGGKFGIINRALGGLRSPWSLLRSNKNY